MALIKCKECGAQISDTAAFCPQCGFNETPRGQNIDSATVVVADLQKALPDCTIHH